VSPDALLRELEDIVGTAHVLVDPELRAGYETDWTGRYRGRALAVVRPATTVEVAKVVRACADARVPIVAQGGNTGLVGGSVPRHGHAAVVVSTQRLGSVGSVDTGSGEVVVGAGAPLTAVQDAARAAGWAVGVDLAARDTATVGGMLATNAGGEHVVRYGRMRNQVLGVEAVLADGNIVGRVPALRKDATGIEWAGVLAGSEGTLAVITQVHLALVPRLDAHVVALAALDDFAALVRVVGALRARLDSLLALEAFFADGLRRVREHTGLPAPFPDEWPAYLLVELATSEDDVARETDRLAAVMDSDTRVRATAVAEDEAGRARLWAYRDRHTEAISAGGVPHKLDVALPHDRLVEFVDRVTGTVAAIEPDAELVLFGHVGDGNIHVNVLGLEPHDTSVDHAVLLLVASMGGSISAEHGIGIAKRSELALTRSDADIAAMRAIKRALDPDEVLNPGVLLPDEEEPRRDGDVARFG
jgi:FAD/FMN-containing dehydrogenase